MRVLPRRPLSRRWRWARVILLLCALWTAIESIFLRRLMTQHTALSRSYTEDSPTSAGKILIAGIHWNNEAILRSHWIDAVLDLAYELGPENVFVSIAESGSWDDTKGALLGLEGALKELGVRHLVTLAETTHADEIGRGPPSEHEDEHPGWLRDQKAEAWRLRRIPYLSRLRNQVLAPLYDELNHTGKPFDRVLFLNDVVFTPQDVYALLATHNGDYAAACSMDFAKPPAFYDTFALRDADGHEAMMSHWPYFRSAQSRAAMKASHPVPVMSCWNGIVAMDAVPFYHAAAITFRGVADSLAVAHVEGSECCLIHADNPLSRDKGVWVNPNVRVAYSEAAYKVVNRVTWPSALDIAVGIWTNRILRWITTPWFKELAIARRVRSWEQEQGMQEPGAFCLINEMQILADNGWAHI